MKKSLSLFISNVIFLVLNAIGLAGCDLISDSVSKSQVEEEAVMYGVPTYYLSGTVRGDINGDGKIDDDEVLPDIKITITSKEYVSSSDDSEDDTPDVTRSAVTDSNGSYKISLEYSDIEGDSAVLQIEDTDTASNGNFSSSTIEVNPSKLKSSSSGWEKSYTKDIDLN